MNNRKWLLLACAGLLAGGASSAQAAYGYGYDNGYRAPAYNNGYYGNGYANNGYAANGVIRCQSHDGRTAFCGVPAGASVRLVDQLSRNSCIQGRTWGVDNRGIWVTNGCRGKFAIVDSRYGYSNNNGYNNSYNNNGYNNNYNNNYSNNGYNNSYNSNVYGYGGGGRIVLCESRNERTVLCGVDARSGVRLVNQYSRSACIEGRTWGVSNSGLWVSRGCRAEFMVGDVRNGYGLR